MAWNDDSNPAQGFKYLYLNAEDYNQLEEGTVNAKEVVEGGETRYALTDIIGQVCLPHVCIIHAWVWVLPQFFVVVGALMWAACCFLHAPSSV